MRRYLPVVILITAVVLVQLLTLAFDASYYLTQLTMSAYYSVVAVGLCLLMGYAGQISLGQAGFFAIGGYTTALLTTRNLVGSLDLPFVGFLDRLGFLLSYTNYYGEEIIYVSPWIAFICALIITTIIALLVGKPVLSLRGHYLAMATLGFGIIIQRIVLGTGVFGEADGIANVPAFPLIPGLAVSGSMFERVQNYYIAWGLVVIVMIVLTNIVHSRVGRGLRALHGGEEAANAMGVNTSRYKLNVFLVGALMASIAGILLTHYNGGIGPSEAGATKSVRYVALVAVGGMANLWGTLTMATILNFLSLRGVFGSYDDAVFGLVLIGIMMFAPDGFLKVQVLRDIRTKIRELPSRLRINPVREKTQQNRRKLEQRSVSTEAREASRDE